MRTQNANAKERELCVFHVVSALRNPCPETVVFRFPNMPKPDPKREDVAVRIGFVSISALGDPQSDNVGCSNASASPSL